MKMKVREAIEMVEKDGWFLVRCVGSHRQFHHKSKKSAVTIAGHPSITLGHDTVKSIKSQAGLA